ncbi:hypothetical protein [Phyllobacterium phragmitis]|uniref:hypothetical protein n=1 Tax=Phyllobacterium phragmitis TaxID=2670329 RepID=UPI0011B289C6|nr:hypothetical protein [Phyllobacterium phragmitis]
MFQARDGGSTMLGVKFDACGGYGQGSDVCKAAGFTPPLVGIIVAQITKTLFVTLATGGHYGGRVCATMASGSLCDCFIHLFHPT